MILIIVMSNLKKKLFCDLLNIAFNSVIKLLVMKRKKYFTSELGCTSEMDGREMDYQI